MKPIYIPKGNTEDLHATRTELTRVQEENERLSYLEEKVVCGYKEGYSKAVIAMRESLKARNKVYCTNEGDLKEMNFVVDQIAKEMLEGENDNT